MLLAIDIGNTNTVLGVFDGEKLDRSWRIKTDSRSTADELVLTYRGLLADHPVDGIAACSTVPAAMRELRQMIADYYGDLPTVLVEPGVRTGVSLQYENPKEVGADRIVNALAAYHLVARTEGVFVEPASAASIAGLLKSIEDGWVAKGSTVVCTVTGNGLKDPDTALKGMPAVTPVPVDPVAVVAKLGLV